MKAGDLVTWVKVPKGPGLILHVPGLLIDAGLLMAHIRVPLINGDFVVTGTEDQVVPKADLILRHDECAYDAQLRQGELNP